MFPLENLTKYYNKECLEEGLKRAVKKLPLDKIRNDFNFRRFTMKYKTRKTANFRRNSTRILRAYRSRHILERKHHRFWANHFSNELTRTAKVFSVWNLQRHKGLRQVPIQNWLSYNNGLTRQTLIKRHGYNLCVDSVDPSEMFDQLAAWCGHREIRFPAASCIKLIQIVRKMADFEDAESCRIIAEGDANDFESLVNKLMFEEMLYEAKKRQLETAKDRAIRNKICSLAI